jgi:predicted Zn-dependent protease with MMP-like domain
VERERFEELVAKSLSELPVEFQDRLENVDVVVMDYPTPRQLTKVGRGMTLLGLYEGVPHTRRSGGYNLALPDRITIFQKPIEARCRSEREIALEIQRVVRHEIAHHFGLDDESLREIESRKPRGWRDAGETLSY